MFNKQDPTPITEIALKENPNLVSLFIKRIDLVHPFISGNKWYKLKYNIRQAVTDGHHTVLTLGGAYSNHIYATAACAREASLTSIGIIRGEEHLPLNPTLSFAIEQGMKLHYLDREQYRNKFFPSVIDNLKTAYEDFYLIPEGGTNALAIKGAAEMISSLEDQFDFIALPVGTGGTMAGIIKGIDKRTIVIGFSVLKGGFLKDNIAQLLKQYNIHGDNWKVFENYHFGGYAKFTSTLISFINKLQTETQIQFDPIYTGKMMYGIIDLISKGYFPEHSKILVVHTGGLQGIKGFNDRFGPLVDILFP